MTDGVSGPHAFGGGDSAVTISVTVITFVVTTFVSAEGLSGGESFMTDGTLVGPTDGVGRACGGCGGGGGGGGLLFAAGEFPVTGLVSTERLVRREGFVTNGAFVSEFGRRIWRRSGAAAVNGGGGGGAAASKHDEAESEVLFFGNVVAGTFGTLAFGPWNSWIVKRERWCGCCWGVESFQSHVCVYE